MTYEDFSEKLDMGYIIYFTYVRDRYSVHKSTENSYTLKLLSDHPKNPLPKMNIVTETRIKEMHPFMEDFEYKAVNEL